MLFALVGNQNCGKTTLFNTLTGAKQKTGNFPGVTVDCTTGIVKEKKNLYITDLPGIYSLRPFSAEEKTARAFLLSQKPDGIINIIDATNPERNLYLTLQLLELGIPTVAALNMMDEVKQNGGKIDILKMGRLLGIPVVPICAANGYGTDKLIQTAEDTVLNRLIPQPQNYFTNTQLKNCIQNVLQIIEPYALKHSISPRFAAIRITDFDKDIEKMLSVKKADTRRTEQIISYTEQVLNCDINTFIAKSRYNYAEKVCSCCITAGRQNIHLRRSGLIDAAAVGKYTAFPLFAVIMFTVFYTTFKSAGGFLLNIAEQLIFKLTSYTAMLLNILNVAYPVKSLVCDGILTGVGSVLCFIPVIAVLFLLLSVLEDTGYMARIAFIMDKPFKKLGLSGRSAVSFLIGFGCTVPAVMSARTLPTERDRKMTLFLTPYISCSAKIPIYTVFCSVFFKNWRHIAIIILYITGILFGILSAFIMKKTVFGAKCDPFVLEMPNYRFPSLKNTLPLMQKKCAEFVKKAFTIILLSSVIIWFLQNFDAKLNYGAAAGDSILSSVGKLIAPFFAPLGFGNRFAAAALICGLTAKESVISALCITLNVSKQGLQTALFNIFTPVSAVSFLVFTLLYTPCAAAVAAVKKELSSTAGALIFAFIQCAVAWIAAYMVYNIGIKLCMLVNI